MDSASLIELRDQLRQHGSRKSLLPGPGASPPEGPPLEGRMSADVLAVVQRVSPICEVLYLLLLADDAEDARELEVLRGAVRALTDGALRTAEIENMLALYATMLERHSRQERLERVTAQLALDRSDAEAAFTLAAAMVIADETPDERERAVLKELRELLGIPHTRAQVLLGEVGVDPSAG